VDTGSQQPSDGAGAPETGVPTWEEIVDRHFVRVFRSLSTYTPGTFEGWIHRITTNLFLDQARRKQRIRFDALSDERADRLRSELPTPDSAYADQTFDDDIERALSTLPPEFRAAVVLCDVEGLSYEEIAEILDAKLGTVRSRIHRGRAMLRTALAHRAPVDGRTRFGGPAPLPQASTS
jgi:RNA polymerase sigma-70 factor (ECF subfamily)